MSDSEDKSKQVPSPRSARRMRKPGRVRAPRTLNYQEDSGHDSCPEFERDERSQDGSFDNDGNSSEDTVNESSMQRPRNCVRKSRRSAKSQIRTKPEVGIYERRLEERAGCSGCTRSDNDKDGPDITSDAVQPRKLSSKLKKRRNVGAQLKRKLNSKEEDFDAQRIFDDESGSRSAKRPTSKRATRSTQRGKRSTHPPKEDGDERPQGDVCEGLDSDAEVDVAATKNEASDDSNVARTTKRGRRNQRKDPSHSRLKLQKKVNSEEASIKSGPSKTDEGDLAGSFDQTSSDDSDGARPKKRIRTDKEEGKPSLRCEHCGVEYSNKYALKYHLDNFVCRPHLQPDKAKRRRSKDGLAPPRSKAGSKQRIRGDVTSRTCPQCQRVFTSIHGTNYHVRNRVCLTVNVASQVPFSTLKPGEQFVTKFGVVQVVRDDRVVPTAQTPTVENDVAKRRKSFKSANDKRNDQIARIRANLAARQRARRSHLNMLFEKNKAENQRLVFQAYFKDDPTMLAVEDRSPVFTFPAPLIDPFVPADSYPDRIVECILIPDMRRRFNVDEDEADETGLLESVEIPSIRLFLRRNMLLEPYNEKSYLFACPKCNDVFTFGATLKNHIISNVCSTRMERMRSSMQKKMETAEERAELYLKKHLLAIAALEKKKNSPSPTKSATPIAAESGIVSTLNLQSIVPVNPKIAAQEKKTDNFESPDDTYAILSNQLRHEQQLHCTEPMYTSVFMALQYKRPRPKKKQRIFVKKRAVPVRQELKRQAKPQKLDEPVILPAAAVPTVLPPIIDVRSILVEIDAGRYPSIKRRPRVVTDADTCCLCKDASGELMCCDVCDNAVHVECMREKFIVKPPEPNCGFMCHFCISKIMHRRMRAEKRRLNKVGEDFAIEAIAKDIAALSQDSIAGREYESVAAQGCQAAELVELLVDAKRRMRLGREFAKLSAIRLGMIGNTDPTA